MRIFRGVTTQCDYLKDRLSNIRRCDFTSDKLCRTHITEALTSPITLRYDLLAKAVGCRLINKNSIGAKELIHNVYVELARKQKIYGDSMEYPIRGFSEGSVIDHINLKIDDKLCIVYNSREPVDDAVYLDILCYIVLYKATVSLADKRFSHRLSLEDLIRKGAIVLAATAMTAVFWMFMVCALIRKNNSMVACVMVISLAVLVIYMLKNYNKNPLTEDTENERQTDEGNKL